MYMANEALYDHPSVEKWIWAQWWLLEELRKHVSTLYVTRCLFSNSMNYRRRKLKLNTIQEYMYAYLFKGFKLFIIRLFRRLYSSLVAYCMLSPNEEAVS